jgi:uncharacterized protein (TIGR03083 family)
MPVRNDGAMRAAEREASRSIMLEERRQLRALLHDLAPEQWHRASLCAGWSVRDVVAHLVAWDDLLLYRTQREHGRVLGRFLWLYARSFASMDRLNARLERDTDGLAPEQLVHRFGADDSPSLRWLFDGTNPGAHLAEYVIHDQDIRVPLRMPRAVPSQHLAAALDGVTKLPGVRWSAWWRLRQRRWEATDLRWECGHGPTTRASGVAILMALAGRPRP